MKKILILSYFFIFEAFIFEVSMASSGERLDIFECKSKTQTYFFKDIYIITLCKPKNLIYDKIFTSNFSIELKYMVSVSKNFLANSSIDEIERHYNLTPEEKEFYKTQLHLIFPSVSKNDRIKLHYNPKESIKFYHNEVFIGEITDFTFAKRVADIWINPNTKFKDTRDFLFL